MGKKNNNITLVSLDELMEKEEEEAQEDEEYEVYDYPAWKELDFNDDLVTDYDPEVYE